LLGAGPLDEVGGDLGEGEAVVLGRRGQQVMGILRGAAALGDENARRLLDDPAGEQGLLQLVSQPGRAPVGARVFSRLCSVTRIPARAISDSSGCLGSVMGTTSSSRAPGYPPPVAGNAAAGRRCSAWPVGGTVFV
jgi:hypothetical protein